MRNICATIWNDEEKESFVKLCTQYYVIGTETCPTTGKLHYQSYGEFKGQVSWDKIKKLLPTTHFEPRHGTAEEAITYCKEDGNFIEWGTPKKQGERKDVHTAKTMALAGSNVKDIILALEEPNFQSIRTAEKLVQYLQPNRTDKPTVKWFWGPTGTGKTKRAIELAEEEVKDAYWISGDTLEWWYGYEGEEFVIIDDFRADFCKFHTLLRYLDRYRICVPVKGGHRQLLAKHIIITCPYPPDEVYRSREDIQQLLRRIDEISHFSDVGGNTIPLHRLSQTTN